MSAVPISLVSSGMVDRMNTTVEITTMPILVKAYILAPSEVSGYSVRFQQNFLARPILLDPKSST